MSIRSLHSPRIVAMVSALVLVASLALPFASARAALGDKCDNAYIMHCGFNTNTDWQKNLNNGDGTNSSANLKQIYSSQGVTETSMMSNDTVEGFVTRDSKVLVNGRVVATNVWSSGRSSLGFDNAVNVGNGVWFHPTGVTFAAGVTQLPALVNMSGGTFRFALMKSCGNIVKPISKPFGLVTKQVKDNTTNSALVAADDAAHALSVNDGDTLEYHVTIGNNGTGDMTNTVFTDDLPTGLALASDANKRHLESNLGTIKPGGAKMISIIVKATATSNDQTIDNNACFTADNGQKGCDHAVVTLKKTVQPAPTPVPTPPAPTPVPEISAQCVMLSARVGSGNIVHFSAQASAGNATVQRYVIHLNSGEEISVVSSASNVTADKTLAPGNYFAVLRIETSAGVTPEVATCKTSFTVVAPPVGGGTVPETPAPAQTPFETPQTGPESALGGALGVGGLGYAAIGYLRSKRRLIESIKHKQ